MHTANAVPEALRGGDGSRVSEPDSDFGTPVPNQSGLRRAADSWMDPRTLDGSMVTATCGTTTAVTEISASADCDGSAWLVATAWNTPAEAGAV